MPKSLIIEAPSRLGLSTDGVQRLADHLLSLGLAERLGARVGPRINAPVPTSEGDPETTILNADQIAAYRIMQHCGIDGRKLGYDHMRQVAMNLAYKRTLIERLRAYPF